MNDERILVVWSDAVDQCQKRFGARLRTFAAMIVQRCCRIMRIESLAVVEFDALAELQRPRSCVGGSIPAFCKLADDAILRGDFRQKISMRMRHRDHEARSEGRGIHGVGRVTVVKPDPEKSTLARRGSNDLF